MKNPRVCVPLESLETPFHPALRALPRVADPGEPSGVLVDLSQYYGHLGCFRDLLPLLVMTNRFTYSPSHIPNAAMQNTWLSIALEGIGTLFACRPPHTEWRNAAVIGTGNGLDAAGISRLARPERIVASDIHPGVLPAARWNVSRYAASGCEIEVKQSDLFDGYEDGDVFDLIYENLPNIPDDRELFEGIRSASCYIPRPTGHRSEWDEHLLTLHHDLLVQARPRLSDRGWAVCVIGGRIPEPVIQSMFMAAGYRPQVIGFGLKIQTEPDVVLPGYVAAEREGRSRFAYYHPLEKCTEVSRGLPQPRDLSSRPEYARELTKRLEPWRISATEALRLHEAGHPVCHSVYVIGGRLSGEDRRHG